LVAQNVKVISMDLEHMETAIFYYEYGRKSRDRFRMLDKCHRS